MSNSKIRTIPLIFFKLEEQAILDWLATLSKNESKEVCLQILFLLQVIHNTDNVKNRVALLNLIEDFLIQYLSAIKVSCWDAGVPLTLEEIGYTEVMVWNFLMLGQCYLLAAKETGFKYYFSSGDKTKDEVYALCKALSLMGQALLHTSAIYCEQNEGFWRTVYQIFTYAEKKNCSI